MVLTASGIDPRAILLKKKAAELSGPKDHWAFVRTDPPMSVAATDRSAYAPKGDVPLGMGYVQAILSILHGLLNVFSYDPPGMAGKLTMRSVSSDSQLYQFSWNQNEDRLLMGGFTHGGQPTFQAAVVGLLHLMTLYRCGEDQQSGEAVERWFVLVKEMERVYPRADASLGWDRRTLEGACLHPSTRTAIIRVSDALRTALTYELPSLGERDVAVFYAPVVGEGEGANIDVFGAEMLDPTFVPRPPRSSLSTSPATKVPTSPAPTFPVLSASPTAMPDTIAGASPLSITSTVVSSPKDEPVIAVRRVVLGPHIDRIRMAIARGEGEAVMVEGATGVGKSLQVIEAALQLDWGIEHLTLHPGWEEEMLYGSYVRIAGRPRFIPGPWTRFALRVAKGERIVFVLDELSRAKETIRDLLIDMLNVYSRASIIAMNSPSVEMPVLLPDGEPGPFYLVNSPITQERFALPVRLVRVVATMNQGEGYESNQMSDPALIRRFSNWLFLKQYEPDIIARILSETLSLSPSHVLIEKMQVISRQVVALGRQEECFRTQMSLPTLQAWGKTALWFYHDPASSLKGNLQQSFIQGAVDTWIQQLCPYKGDELDAEMENRLLGIVGAALPRTLEVK